ncbi:MAG: protein of unknown function with transrane region [Candidatus Kaiserbacteria bacterium]|nr:protein of unknown function with transrane region [Candidatus Kaiserbacteria bacterium]
MQDETLGGGILTALHYAGDIMFRWIPGTVEAVSGVTPGPSPVITPITQPITTGAVSNFLQTTASAEAFSELYTDWHVLVTLSIIISIILMIGIVYCVLRIFQIRKTEEDRFRASAHPVAAKDVSRVQLRWNRIVEQTRTENEQNWRLAILEADIMLNDLLDQLGYRGETMADKMKQIERTRFNSIDMAWEAHLVRNAIAHQGSLQALTQREARRVVGLYEHVFREFRYIV